MPRTLHLLRHAEPDIAKGHCYGALDIACKPLALTVCIANHLPVLHSLPTPLSIFCSPALRCTALADRLQQALPHTTLETCPALAELNFGRWEGRSWDDIYATDAAGLDAWACDPVGYAAGGGESLAQLHTRVTTWLQAWLACDAPSHGLVITHGGPLKVLLACAAAQAIAPPQAALDQAPPPWGSLRTIELTF